MRELKIWKEGMYRKVICPYHRNCVELFYVCNDCEDFKGINKNGNVLCSYPK